MSNTFEQEKLKDFTVIRNSIFKDYTLSAKAKGVACQLLSLPPTWDYSVRGLVELFDDGEASIRSALTELEERGYLRRERVRNQGKLGKAKYVITDMLKSEKPNVENPLVENPHVENSAVENPPQLNTKELNTNTSNTKGLNTHSDKKRKRANNTDLNNTPSLRPSLEEIASYIEEKGFNVDAQMFYDYFDASEWVDSKGNPVRNWKHKIITWSKNNDTRGSGKERQGVRGTNGKRDGSVRDVRPEWFRPFETLPIDERSQDDA